MSIDEYRTSTGPLTGSNVSLPVFTLPFKMGTTRVYTTIHLDDRRDKKVILGDKVKSVRKRLGQRH